MSISVLSVQKDVAPFDRDKAWDGGSYYQPTVVCTLSNGGKVVIDDSSCGAFGPRYSAVYTDASGAECATYSFDGCVPFGQPVIGGGTFRCYPDVAEAVHTATGYDLIWEGET